MKKESVDVLIHIRPGSDTDLIAGAIKQVTCISGVIAAKINPWVQSLISINYNPEQLSSTDIIKSVRRNGYTASMIGM